MLGPPPQKRWIIMAFAASATASLIGASVSYTWDVSDGVAVSLVALGGIVGLTIIPNRWGPCRFFPSPAQREKVPAYPRADEGSSTSAGSPHPAPKTAPPSPGGRREGTRGKAQALLPVLAALALRIPWLFAPPAFSDDVYRYVWEGRVWAAGFNPFALAPADPMLAALTPSNLAIWERVNHPEVSSIYPPLAQALFVILAPGGVLAWKIAAMVADLGTVGLLARRSPRAGWLWALLPLPALESAGSGHLEAFGVLFLVATLSAEATGRPRLALAAAWAGAMVKLLPGAGVLALAKGWRAWLTVGGASLLVFAPMWTSELLRGFQTYRATWSFNGSLYPLLAAGVGSELARGALQVVGAGVVGGVWWRTRSRPNATWAVLMAATGGFVLLSPTVHPWYVLWPLAVALWGGGGGGWLLAAVLVPLAYRVLGTLMGGVWTEEAVTRWVIWGPVWGMLGVEALGRSLRATPRR